MKVSQTDKLAGFAWGDIFLRPFAGEKMMAVHVVGQAGAVASLHSHPHEQITFVMSGRIRCIVDGEQKDLGAGEILHLPSNVPHEVTFLEPSTLLDMFHPLREDFLEKVNGKATV